MKKRNFNRNAASFCVRKLILYIKKYSSIILLISLFACGLIFGTVFVKHSEYFRYILSVFVSSENDIVRMLVNSCFSVFIMLTFNFIMGLCLVGLPFICFLSVAEGIVFGSLYSYQLFVFGYESFGRFFVTDIFFFICLYVVFICSQYTSAGMSDSLKKFFCNRKGNVNLRSYLVQMSVYGVLSMLLIFMQISIKYIS